MSKVSIILTLESGDKELEAIAKSLALQELSSWEMILVSRDGYNYKKHLEKAKLDDARIYQYFLIGEEGRAYQYGMEIATGTHILLMEKGERFYPDRLRKLLEKDGFVVGNNYIVSENKVVKRGMAKVGAGSDLLYSDYSRLYKKPSLLFRRSLAEFVGSDELLVWGRDAYQAMLLREVDGAYLVNEILHEIRVDS